MSVDELIVSTLSNIAPTFPNLYKGSLDKYIVFNYSERPDDYSDDAPHEEIYLVQVHLFCSNQYDPILEKKRIKELLRLAGFSFPSVINASDNERQHYVFECEWSKALDNGEF